MSASRPRPRPRRPAAVPAAAAPAPPEVGSFRSDLRAVLRPGRAWHHVFAAAVVLTGVAYWVLSLLVQPGASWAEIALYRPKGDNQVYPIITALSQFNLGDPTDAVVHGRGVGGFQAVILLPYVVAFALLGPPGYMVADAVLSLAYFVGAALFLRRCGAGAVTSLWVAAGLATQALPLAMGPISQGLREGVGALGRSLAEWDFPDLTSLLLFQKRIPRPMVTEVFLVFLLYFLVRQWRSGHPPTARWGVAVGFLMAMLVQGDPYSFGAAGLVLLAVMGAAVRRAGGRIPWPTVAGGLGGALAGGAYFLFQLWHQDPEAAARFGLAPFPRDRIRLLPGYGPWLRLACIGALAWAVARWGRRAGVPAGPGSLPAFALVLVAAGWLAQPVQLLLLGQGAQIYHYFYFTLPTFYAYALVVLVGQALRLALRDPGPWPRLRARLPRAAWLAAGVAASLSLLLTPFGEALAAARQAGTARQETSPWAALGPAYRTSFRELDRRYREDPRLRETRTFSTFNHEANFLLTAFHGKRAVLPDNAYSTLPDAELERRLFFAARLLQFSPEQFDGAILNNFVLNYWLGCAKYWCGDEHKFAPDHDYTTKQLAHLRELGPLPPFNLALPRSQFQRIALAYRRFLQEPLDPGAFPDTIVLSSVLWSQGAAPIPGLYEQLHRDEIFAIYLKTAAASPAR